MRVKRPTNACKATYRAAMARPRQLRGARQAVARLPQRRHVQVLGCLRMRSVPAAYVPRMLTYQRVLTYVRCMLTCTRTRI